MKPNCKGCSTGIVRDFTNNPMRLCTNCLWSDVISRYDMGGVCGDTCPPVDQISMEKIEMIEESNNHNWSRV